MSGVFYASATTERLGLALDVAPPHLRPVLLAVRDYRVGMLFAPQGGASFSIPSHPPRAAIVFIGDDMEISTGPDGFDMPSLRRAIRACTAFTIVTSAPTAEIYAAGTAPAVAGRNAMIIETRLEHELEWVSLVQKLAPRRPILLATIKGGNA